MEGFFEAWCALVHHFVHGGSVASKLIMMFATTSKQKRITSVTHYPYTWVFFGLGRANQSPMKET
jgi:hypothetical protein